MSNLSNYINELKTSEAFSKQSIVFDKQYNNNRIIRYKRKRVREHVLQLLPSNASILELNCGTGDDALFFAGHGHHIHATDISDGMLERLKEKIQHFSFNGNITTETCSFNYLETLNNKGPFDMIFSNFGGLNCTDELDKVLSSFHSLLKPAGVVSLVVIPKFCLWESLLFLKGQFKTATRRFFSRHGRKAHVEGVFFKCWYYSPRFVTKHLQNHFELLKLEGLCTLVPPSYMEGFPEKHPGLFRFLLNKEESWKAKWPWRSIGDYFIISLRKKI